MKCGNNKFRMQNVGGHAEAHAPEEQKDHRRGD
jgi:hypothetical protein